MTFFKTSLIGFVFVLLLLPLIVHATVSFSSDTDLNFNNLNKGSLKINKGSEAQKVNVYDKLIEAVDITSNTPFVLSSPSHNKVLSIEPVDNSNLDLVASTTHFNSSTEVFSEWGLKSNQDMAVKIDVMAEKNNTYYQIDVDQSHLDSFQSDNSGLVSFSYSDGFTTKNFTISKDYTDPKSFTLSSPVDGEITNDPTPNFSWNASASPDVSSYNLLIDSSVNKTVGSSTLSAAPSNELSCGSHTWSIEAVDKAGNSFTTNQRTIEISCGGGRSISSFNPPSPPSSGEFDITINGGREVVSDREIKLSFEAGKEIVDMAISEDKNFFDSSIEDFSKTKKWTLSSSTGKKTIYTKFYNEQGISSPVVSESVVYKKEKDKTPKVSECSLEPGQAYSFAGTNAVYYITESCTKRPFRRSDVFFSYFDSWGEVKSVEKRKLNNLDKDNLGFMPWGPKKELKSGSLVKTVDSSKVYILLSGKKYWLENETVFTSLNYDWNMITDVHPKVMNNYVQGKAITYTDHHSKHSLVKYSGSSKVYRLEENQNGKLIKRHIKTQSCFDQLSYRLDRIITIEDSEEYITGTPITCN